MNQKSSKDTSGSTSTRATPVNPGKDCVELLNQQGIKSRIIPSYDNVVNFFSSAKKKIVKMDQKTMACVKKEATLLKKDADSTARTVINQERREFVKLMEQRTKDIERGSKGTVLKMSTQRQFKDLV